VHSTPVVLVSKIGYICASWVAVTLAMFLLHVIFEIIFLREDPLKNSSEIKIAVLAARLASSDQN